MYIIANFMHRRIMMVQFVQLEKTILFIIVLSFFVKLTTISWSLTICGIMLETMRSIQDVRGLFCVFAEI